MMRVLFLTNIPSPYRVDFFNEFGKSCELTVVFEKHHSSERSDGWEKNNFTNFKGVFLKGLSTRADAAFCPSICSVIKKNKYDFIFVTNFSDITGILAILLLRMKKMPYFIESDGGFPGTLSGVKARIKRFILKGAEAYFSTGESHDDYYIAYGVSHQKIVRYPFSSIHEADIISEPISVKEKDSIRDKLGMTEKRIILAVGRFIEGKGYDVLISAMKSFGDEVGCYIVGGIPLREYIDLVNTLDIHNVHFVPFLDKEHLSNYYKAADVFVHPTRSDVWGLVINEAMAYGLPIVTTSKCGAGIELIKDDDIGIIVPDGDVKALQEAIKKITRSTDEDSSRSKTILEICKKYTIESMALAHVQYLLHERDKGC